MHQGTKTNSARNLSNVLVTSIRNFNIKKFYFLLPFRILGDMMQL